MPWLETESMDQRLRFIRSHQEGAFSMTELCARFGISRKTGYKWLSRYDEHGKAGLADQSRAPKSCPHRTNEYLAELLVQTRKMHPFWGPRKLIPWLQRRYPHLSLPAASTVGGILSRRGLVPKRRRRIKHPHPGCNAASSSAPNDLWTADFKGQFRTGDRAYCYPLTIVDHFSRRIILCQGYTSVRQEGARAGFLKAFKPFGIPKAIRTDNGTPFASRAMHGLSRLNSWWLRIGIDHQRIRPGSPQDNGSHERMHRTLKREVCRSPRANLSAQQRAFDAFVEEFNDERPHEAIGYRTPSDLYRPSERPFPGKIPPPNYPGHYLIRKVSKRGCIRLKNKQVFISLALDGHRIGLSEEDDGLWNVYLNDFLLAKLDERASRLHH